jgi:hypothetical protein
MVLKSGKLIKMVLTMVVCSFPGLGQNALSLSLGTTAPTSAASNEGLGGIDFSTSSDKKSK